MKKIISLVLVMGMAAVLASCGGSGNSGIKLNTEENRQSADLQMVDKVVTAVCIGLSDPTYHFPEDVEITVLINEDGLECDNAEMLRAIENAKIDLDSVKTKSDVWGTIEIKCPVGARVVVSSDGDKDMGELLK